SDDVAHPSLFEVGALETLEAEKLGDARLLDTAAQLVDRHFIATLQAAREDASQRQPAVIVAVVEVGHEQLQRDLGFAVRSGNGSQDGLEERLQSLGRVVQGGLGDAAPGDGVEDGKVELVFSGVEIDEKIVDLVDHFLRTRVAAVNLVDGHDRGELGLERLAQYVA